MAEVIKVQVQAETRSAEDALRKAQQLADSLGKKQTTIRIKAEGIDGLAKQIRVVENETAKLALSADTFRALSSGAITATQAMEDMGAKVNRVNTDMQSFIDHATGVSRETSQITAKTSMFGKVSDDTFKSYTSGAMSGADATQTLQKGMSVLGNETEKTSGIFDSLTKRFTAANLISSAVTRGITLLRTALRQAVSEMKEMDKELTTIKMVSGASDSYINQLTNQAFAGARANGRSVTDYLSAAEMFTRAGYRDNIDQLSQLALMTQNIGGVEEDVAGKFLLAADAAWKLGGNYESLMGVLDGVSSVADQNATDLGKIAEGITIAGTAMANAGVSAKEFTAMLGLTTASTQRSGSEMARGLRTILFRVRQVKAEFDDGEVINADDISNAAKALKEVADIEVIDKQTNDLKSFSDIMSELAEKWVTLDDKQKQYLQNALAGQRQGNVLFAWLENWDKYEELMQQYEDSAGTALEKNAKYTESWAAETEKLKSAWTETVSLITSSGELQKGFARDFSGLLNSINGAWKKAVEMDNYMRSHGYWEWDDYGNYVYKEDSKMSEEADRKVAQDAYSQRYMWSGYAQSVEKADEELKKYTDDAKKAADGTDDLTGSTEKSATAFEKQRDRISEVAKAIKEEKNDAVNSLADIYKAAMEAADKGYYGSNAYRQGGALFFSSENLDELEREGKLSAREYLDAYFKEIDSGDYSTAAANFFGKITKGSNEIKDDNGQIIASMKDLGDSFMWTFDKGTQSMDEYLQTLSSKTGISETFWASMIESLGMYSDELAKWTENDGKIKVDASEAKDEIDEVQKKRDDLEDKEITISADTEGAQSNIGAVQTARDNLEDKTITITVNTVTSNTGTGNKVRSGAFDKPFSENDDSWIVSEHTVPSTTSNSTNTGYNWSGYRGKATGKRDSYSGIALVNDEFPADGSKPELIISNSTGRAYIANGGRPALVNLASDDIVLTASETKSAFGVPGFPVGKNINFLKDVGVGGNKAIGGAGNAASGSALKAVTPKTAPSNSGGGGGGGSSAEQASVPDPTENWNQLKKLIDYMVDEQKDILDDHLDVLDKQLKELEATRKEQKTEDELAQKQLKVDEALLDLEKAQVERTVRYYNESTGQWEWMADQGALAKAEEAYSDALKELNDFLAELDFNEQKAAIQAQKDALQEAFDAYKEGWDLIVKEIEKPTGDLAALFEELKVNGTEAMKSQAGNIESLLGALETGFFTGIGDVTLVASSGVGGVTDAAASGITDVVNRAKSFLDSVKQDTNKASSTSASAAKSSSGGGGGSSGSGSAGGTKGSTVMSSTSKKGISEMIEETVKTTFAQKATMEAVAEQAAKTAVQSVVSTVSKVINNNGNNTFINGVKIGNDQMSTPLNKVLANLRIQQNTTAR